MSKIMTRKELYDLVWSKPGTHLAKDLGVSDVAISKACKRYDISRPPMGHWAKVNAGKAVHQKPLPQRGPGMADQIEIGGGRYSYARSQGTDEERAKSNPQPPVFEYEMSDVRALAKKRIKKVQALVGLDKPHRLIQKYLKEEEERRKYQKKTGYSWRGPIFDEPIEQRRLSIISSLFTVAEQNGLKPSISGKEARSLGIKVNDQEVPFTLDATSQTPNRWGEISINTRGDSSKLKLKLGNQHYSIEPEISWEDHGRGLIENKLREILIEIIVTAEQEYRDWLQRKYEWAIEAKERAIESLRKKREEEERFERERVIQLEQARIDRLLEGAAALKQANEIRDYIRSVSERISVEPDIVESEKFEEWVSWANDQADRIDPVIGGCFINEIKERAES